MIAMKIADWIHAPIRRDWWRLIRPGSRLVFQSIPEMFQGWGHCSVQASQILSNYFFVDLALCIGTLSCGPKHKQCVSNQSWRHTVRRTSSQSGDEQYVQGHVPKGMTQSWWCLALLFGGISDLLSWVGRGLVLPQRWQIGYFLSQIIVLLFRDIYGLCGSSMTWSQVSQMPLRALVAVFALRFFIHMSRMPGWCIFKPQSCLISLLPPGVLI